MQLRLWLAAAVIVAPAPARADGEVTLRGAYYKERATRVAQPMLDARFEVGDAGELTAHTLVDSISSASVAAGSGGQAFSEVRYEAGAAYLHRLAEIFRLGGGARGVDRARLQERVRHAPRRGRARRAQHDACRSTSPAAATPRATPGPDHDHRVGRGHPLHDARLAVADAGALAAARRSGHLRLSYLDGFQENPYRTVSAGGVLEQERVPDTRLRNAAFGSLRAYLPATRSTVAAGYRFYVDDWGVIGHTPELRAVQDLPADVSVQARYRWHHQGAADFYKTTYATADPDVEPHLTDDVKLSELTTQTFGLSVGFPLGLLGARGDLQAARVDGLFEYITQTTYFGNAVVAQVALSVPFEY